MKTHKSRIAPTNQEILAQIEQYDDHELIDQLPEVEEDYDVTQDPLYDFSAFDLKAAINLSQQVDDTLYGEAQLA